MLHAIIELRDSQRSRQLSVIQALLGALNDKMIVFAGLIDHMSRDVS